MKDHEFLKLTEKMKISTLLAIGKRIASTDYAVRFYYKKNHPKFHLKREQLEKSVRRAFGIGAFNHKEQAIDILERLEPELMESDSE